MHARLRNVVLPILAGCIACAGASTRGRTRVDHSLLTHDQLEEQPFENLLEAVQTLRASWLNMRGPDSFLTPTEIWVYLDETRFGGVRSLAQIWPRYVSSVRKLNGIDATARWGIGHSAGVIAVTTWPSREDSSRVSSTPRADSASAWVDGSARGPD